MIKESLSIVPACGGAETWTKYRNGKEYLYCWDRETGLHGWLDRSDTFHLIHPDDQ